MRFCVALAIMGPDGVGAGPPERRGVCVRFGGLFLGIFRNPTVQPEWCRCPGCWVWSRAQRMPGTWR